MKHKSASAVLVLAFIVAVPAHAGFLSEKVDDGIYFVSYQRGQVFRGNFIFDTEKRVKRRMENKSHKFCLREGYSHLKFPTLAEIASDETLRAVWQVGSGDEGQNASEPVGLLFGLAHTHKSRRILLLSKDAEEGFAACRIP